MEVSVWESCLIKRVRTIQEQIKKTSTLDSEYPLIVLSDLLKLVDNDVLILSHETKEEVEEESNEEQIPQPLTFCIDWDLFKENKYEVYLLPKTNRSEEIRIRTKVSLLAVRKGYVIKIIDKTVGNLQPIIIEVINVEEGFDNKSCMEYLHIKGIQLNKLTNGE